MGDTSFLKLHVVKPGDKFALKDVDPGATGEIKGKKLSLIHI